MTDRTQSAQAGATRAVIECTIAQGIHPGHYARSFHSSRTIGTFGAMAATAASERAPARP